MKRPGANLTETASFRGEDRRWAAVSCRDGSADGQFVYGVVTTGIYCRPSCPSRRPKRENVRFFALPQDAEAAGFRACKRCQPQAVEAERRTLALVREACRRIETAAEEPRLAALAAAAGLSPFHFHRLFKAAVGITPKAYARAHRQQRVRRELTASPTVTAAALEAGYGSSSRFYDEGDGVLGMTPSQYRAGGGAETITFAIGPCSLGAILVAATAKGVCAIALGDDPALLLADLQDRFPQATLTGGDATFDRLVAQVIAAVEAPGLTADLPLDIRGTAFQHRVWEALRAIPAGETASYADIAEQIGSPKAVRAVAGACAANPLAVAIPCHRVVRSDGDLSGYRWGIARKAELLKRERKPKR